MRVEELTENWILSEVEKIKYTYGLNNVIRYNLDRKEEFKTQSVSEHVYSMLILAHYFRDLEDPEHKLDMEKITRMILMHDMGEIETGDIIMGFKNKELEEVESRAIHNVMDKSPDFIQKEIRSLFDDFENPITGEGKFAKAIDKVEAQFWFSAVCHDLKMIKEVTAIETRIKNEAKRKDIYPELGFQIIEKFGKILDEDATKRGLYL